MWLIMLISVVILVRTQSVLWAWLSYWILPVPGLMIMGDFFQEWEFFLAHSIIALFTIPYFFILKRFFQKHKIWFGILCVVGFYVFYLVTAVLGLAIADR